jgi:sporulation protein YlmC with PRC-barrel domain
MEDKTMLRSLKEVEGYTILATDGEVGSVEDFYFDDQYWTVRYLVVDTGGWLSGRRVLLTPLAVERPDWGTGTLPVALTKDQVENSPDIDLDKPVSRQREVGLHDHYGWAYYWADLSTPATAVTTPPPPAMAEERAETEREKGDPHLRSVDEVTGYDIQARDGEIGHVEDFIADDETWIMRYLVVDTRDWLPGKKVLVAPAWVRMVNWADADVHVDLLRETIKNSPEYDPAAPVNRAYEERLYDYYGRPRYW